MTDVISFGQVIALDLCLRVKQSAATLIQQLDLADELFKVVKEIVQTCDRQTRTRVAGMYYDGILLKLQSEQFVFLYLN